MSFVRVVSRCCQLDLMLYGCLFATWQNSTSKQSSRVVGLVELSSARYFQFGKFVRFVLHVGLLLFAGDAHQLLCKIGRAI